ncbi:MAG: hypothetical protein JSR82_08990 [Verrucomicrobia bacterium]|nr:hypothetical protein [Verrucomicrobiota bacterium]
MATLIFPAVLILATLLAEALQSLVPALASLHGARVLLFPALLAYGSLALPLPGVLLLAFVAGMFWNLLTLQVVTTSATAVALKAPLIEISTGAHIFLFGVLCTLMHGMRPLFLRGRWEVHVVLAGFCTATLLLVEYLLLNLRRGGFDFSSPVWWRIFVPALASMLLAPVIYAFFTLLAHFVGYPVREDPRESRRSLLSPVEGL